MRSIIHIARFVLDLTLAITVTGCLAAASNASAQATATTPPASATYKGCVQKAPGSEGTLVISTPNACAKLAGKVSADALAGHEVELQGILTPRTPSVAASIQVDSVTHVGAACSNVCALQPPTRGLHRPQSNDVPGTEGGTPGAVAPHPAIQPN
jgi:hypothetical protein